MTHLAILILSLYHVMHLFNTAFKLFCNLIHDDILLVSIVCNYERIFQSVIFSMFKCFQNFSKFLKSSDADSIVFTQFCTVDVVVAL